MTFHLEVGESSGYTLSGTESANNPRKCTTLSLEVDLRKMSDFFLLDACTYSSYSTVLYYGESVPGLFAPFKMLEVAVSYHTDNSDVKSETPCGVHEMGEVSVFRAS